jgi:hypothetical protein
LGDVQWGHLMTHGKSQKRNGNPTETFPKKYLCVVSIIDIVVFRFVPTWATTPSK